MPKMKVRPRRPGRCEGRAGELFRTCGLLSEGRADGRSGPRYRRRNDACRDAGSGWLGTGSSTIEAAPSLWWLVSPLEEQAISGLGPPLGGWRHGCPNRANEISGSPIVARSPKFQIIARPCLAGLAAARAYFAGRRGKVTMLRLPRPRR